MDIPAQKATLRRQMKQELKALSSEVKNKWSQEICEKLRAALPATAHTIAAFYPLATEPNILPLLKELQQHGKRIAFPYWQNDHEPLHFYEVTDWSLLETDKFGITQPRPDVVNEVKEFDVVLVPGLAFDQQGNRLGRSKGVYDRFLTQLLPKAHKIAICFEVQLINEVPVTEHDQRVDTIITNDQNRESPPPKLHH